MPEKLALHDGTYEATVSNKRKIAELEEGKESISHELESLDQQSKVLEKYIREKNSLKLISDDDVSMFNELWLGHHTYSECCM